MQANLDHMEAHVREYAAHLETPDQLKLFLGQIIYVLLQR